MVFKKNLFLCSWFISSFLFFFFFTSTFASTSNSDTALTQNSTSLKVKEIKQSGKNCKIESLFHPDSKILSVSLLKKEERDSKKTSSQKALLREVCQGILSLDFPKNVQVKIRKATYAFNGPLQLTKNQSLTIFSEIFTVGKKGETISEKIVGPLEKEMDLYKDFPLPEVSQDGWSTCGSGGEVLRVLESLIFRNSQRERLPLLKNKTQLNIEFEFKKCTN